MLILGRIFLIEPGVFVLFVEWKGKNRVNFLAKWETALLNSISSFRLFFYQKTHADSYFQKLEWETDKADFLSEFNSSWNSFSFFCPECVLESDILTCDTNGRIYWENFLCPLNPFQFLFHSSTKNSNWTYHVSRGMLENLVSHFSLSSEIHFNFPCVLLPKTQSHLCPFKNWNEKQIESIFSMSLVALEFRSHSSAPNTF